MLDPMQYVTYGPDAGDGDGQAVEQQDAGDERQETGDATGDNGGEQRTFTQDELDRIIQERLERERRKLAQQREAEREEQERKRLEEQQQYQELAERLKGELEELKPAAQTAQERVEALTALIAEQINREIAEWPEEVKALAPSEASAEEMLAWLEKARPMAEKLSQRSAAPGNTRGPRAAGAKAATERELRKAARQRVRRIF